MILADIAKILDAKIHGTDQIDIHTLAMLDGAGNGQLSFVAKEEYRPLVASTKASAIIAREVFPEFKGSTIVHDNPYLAFAKISQIFWKPKHNVSQEFAQQHRYIHPTAKIAASAMIFPFAYIEENCVIGENSVIYPHTFIGRETHIGNNTTIYANVSIYPKTKIGNGVIIHSASTIGGDGFGYARDDKTGRFEKIPQIGILVIEDEVEIGSGVTIDRAALSETRIGAGTKLDSQVHVAHNVTIGKDCSFSGNVGIAGSAKIGDRVIVGGQSAINGHISVASDTRVGGMTGVVKTIEKAGDYMGFPAQEAGPWRRLQVFLKRLPSYEKRLKNLEEKI